MPRACMGHASIMGETVTGGAGVVGAGVNQEPPLVRFFCGGCRRLSYGGHGWDLCVECRLKALRKGRSPPKK
jgi:hypothetical protein